MVQMANRSAVIAPGGRFLAFATTGKLLGVFDFTTQTSSLAVSPGWNPSLSADGRWLAFEGLAADFGTNSGNTISDVFLLDRNSGTVRLVSVAQGGSTSGNGPSSTPLISRDGRYVVFKSKASDLVTGDTNGVTDIFVSDLMTGSQFALSAGLHGRTGSRISGTPLMGADGRTVVFESYAPDLAPGDFNDAKDVFVLRLPGDVAAEFRILTLTSLNAGSMTLFWNSIPGKTYRVQFKENLPDALWQELPGDVVAESYTCSKTDSSTGAAPTRFYRIRLLD
jgi:Tol biopolymer transport system component